jgi:hypothetical protein
MRLSICSASATATAACLWLVGLGTASAALETAEEIRECSHANFPESTSIQLIELKSLDRAGSERVMDARLHWKRHNDGHVRLMIRILGPQDLKGSAYLVIENKPRDSVYLYAPAIGRPRRIVGGGGKGIWGTDFSYEDIRLLQMSSTATPAERLPDSEVAGRATYVISQSPDADRESVYVKTVSYVDKETCVSLQTEYYEAEDQPRKRLLVDPETVKQVGGKWTAHDLEITDLGEDTRSWIQVKDISVDEDISARFFNTVQFYKN